MCLQFVNPAKAKVKIVECNFDGEEEIVDRDPIYVGLTRLAGAAHGYANPKTFVNELVSMYAVANAAMLDAGCAEHTALVSILSRRPHALSAGLAVCPPLNAVLTVPPVLPPGRSQVTFLATPAVTKHDYSMVVFKKLHCCFDARKAVVTKCLEVGAFKGQVSFADRKHLVVPLKDLPAFQAAVGPMWSNMRGKGSGDVVKEAIAAGNAVVYGRQQDGTYKK